jgi:hypothetical protein
MRQRNSSEDSIRTKLARLYGTFNQNKWSNLFADEQKVNPTLCGGKSRGSKPQNASIEL